MARPQSDGIDYFPLDTNTDKDDKMYFILAKHGVFGFGFLIRLYQKIYSNGYWLHFPEKQQVIFAAVNNIDLNVCKNLVNDYINEDLFDINLFKKYQILTSRGIQKRYFKICERRKFVRFVPEFTLIDVNEYKNLVNVDIKQVNVDMMSTCLQQSKVNKSKVKESKVNNISSKKKPKRIKPTIDFQKEIADQLSKFHSSRRAVENFISLAASRNKTGLISESRKLSLLCQLSDVLAATDEKTFNIALLEVIDKEVVNINYLKRVVESKQKKGGNSGRPPDERGSPEKEATGSSRTGKYAHLGEELSTEQ